MPQAVNEAQRHEKWVAEHEQACQELLRWMSNSLEQLQQHPPQVDSLEQVEELLER